MALTNSKIRREKRKYSYEDYMKIPDDGKRYEILNGELIMSPSPTTLHQRVVGKLFTELKIFVEKNNLGEVFISPYDVILNDNDIVQPDIIFMSNENVNIITDENIKGSPDLLVEILSPSTGYYDLVEKKDIYEKSGIKEYWIVDPQKKWIEVYSLKQHKYYLFNRIEKKGKIKSMVLNSLDLDIHKIFEALVKS